MTLPEAQPHPCRECPWVKDSIRGWLGPWTADEWVGLAHSDEPIACHMTITNDGEWDDDTLQCRGSAMYRANVCKSPRNPEIVTGPKSDLAFSSPVKFKEHHAF